MLNCFDLLNDAGQKRLIFRQAQREYGQTIEKFYAALLGMAAKAFLGESSATVDRMILDQIICGCGKEKVQMYLMEKALATSREALSLAVAYQAAIKYNENLRETSTSISSTYAEREQGENTYGSRGQRRTEFPQNFRNYSGVYEDHDKRNSYNIYYERGEDNRGNSNNMYFNRRRSEYSTRAQANFQNKGKQNLEMTDKSIELR